MTKEKFPKRYQTHNIGPIGHVDHGRTTIDATDPETELLRARLRPTLSTPAAGNVPNPSPENPTSQNINVEKEKQR